MKLPRNELAQVIGERTLDIKDPALLAKEVAAYLLTENRLNELDSLLRDIMQYRLEHGIIEAVAVSAHELNDIVHDGIKAILRTKYPKAKHIIVRDRRDPSVIGGVRIELANEQLDLSVQATLNKFKQLTALERNTL